MEIFEDKGLDVGGEAMDGATMAHPVNCVGV